MKVKEIYSFLDKIAPFETAAPWDNCGLSVGSLQSDVSKVLISLDVTSDVIKKAQEMGAELVITHHPLIFNPIKALTSDTIQYEAVKSGVNFIASHTCLDKADGGVNDTLAEEVGIENTRTSEFDSFLKIGEVPETEPKEFAEKLKKALNTNVQYVDCGKKIKTVAFCSGSGGDFFEIARLENADALLTGEAKYHDLLDAKHIGISVFCAGHYETEVIVCEKLKELLENHFENIEFEIYKGERPIKYI